MKKFSALLFLAAVTLVGCGKDPVQTVDWYKENTPERLAMLEKCKSNPGELEASPNCINAKSAQFKIAFSRSEGVKAVPPKFTR